jgi:arginyl-tRNA synthetase
LEGLEGNGSLPEDVDLERLAAPEELDLVQRLADYSSLVARSAAAREPHRLTNYCEETARAFHQFYHHHRVVQADRELGRARLALCHATRRVLASALDLMAISAPQSM